MVKTVRITTKNEISVIELPSWDQKAKAIGADCTETVKTLRMYEIFGDVVTMIVDDTGLMDNRPMNPVASYLYGADKHGRIIAGDVLFAVQRGPDILPPDDAEQMMQFLIERFPCLSKEKGLREKNI